MHSLQTRHLIWTYFVFAALCLQDVSEPESKPNPYTSTWIVNLDRVEGKVEFFGKAVPTLLKVHGTGDAPHGKFEIQGRIVTGSANVQLDTLKTGIPLRDKHLKEKYLETQKYPQAVFTLTRLELPAELGSPSFFKEGIPFQGKLSMHGSERPVNGQATIQQEADHAKVDAHFNVKIDEFGIAKPEFAGITLENNVDVKVSFSAPLKARK